MHALKHIDTALLVLCSLSGVVILSGLMESAIYQKALALP